jgi:Zinc knuckle
VLDEKDQHREYRNPPEVQSAFVTDSVLVAKAKATLDVGDKKPSGKERRRRPLSEVTCYSCHAKGHYARDCKVRPRSEDALVTYGNSDGSDSDNETAYMTTDVSRNSETALFSSDEVLIDSQASVNVFNSQHLLSQVSAPHCAKWCPIRSLWSRHRHGRGLQRAGSSVLQQRSVGQHTFSGSACRLGS